MASLLIFTGCFFSIICVVFVRNVCYLERYFITLTVSCFSKISTLCVKNTVSEVCDFISVLRYDPYTFHISGAGDYRNEDSRGQLYSPISHVAPVNPGLHLHVNELLPSIHSPPFLQGLLTHSLISEN